MQVVEYVPHGTCTTAAISYGDAHQSKPDYHEVWMVVS